MNSKVYKWCGVPQCANTSIKTPDKLFVYVPHKTIRYKWLKLARRDSKAILPSTQLYFCEDHFDLPNDMLNFVEYRVMGKVSQVRMKPGCTPSKFGCQEDIRKHTGSGIEQTCSLKNKKLSLTVKHMTELKESVPVLSSADCQTVDQNEPEVILPDKDIQPLSGQEFSSQVANTSVTIEQSLEQSTIPSSTSDLRLTLDSEAKMCEEDVSNECRACLRGLEGEARQELFQVWYSPWAITGSLVADDLSKLADVAITEDDNYSKVICIECFNQFKDVCLFLASVRQNDSVLRSRNVITSDNPWPTPILLDKNINMSNTGLMDETGQVDIKQEVLSEDENYTNNMEQNWDDIGMDIKIEPEEIVAPVVSVINGAYSLAERNEESIHMNGTTDYNEEITNEAAHNNVLPEDDLLEAKKQKILLDTFPNSLSLTHRATDNFENNISISSRVDINQMENYDSGSKYLYSVEFSTETNTTENCMLQSEEKSFNNINYYQQELSAPTVNMSETNPSIPSINMTTTQASILNEENSIANISQMSTGHHDTGELPNPLISEPIINTNRIGPKKGRKRKYPEQTREIRKKLCETNNCYINQKGEVVSRREFIDVICNDGCHEKLSAKERLEEFSTFWRLGFEAKCLYIYSNVKVASVKRKRNMNSNKRNNTRVYSFRNIVVCAKMFIDTLRISSARIDRYLKKCSLSGSEIIEDKRGKKKPNTHKVPQDIEHSIIKYNDIYPNYKSPFCRAQTDTMYSALDMTMPKMCDLYLSQANSELKNAVSFAKDKTSERHMQ